jgi:lipopolysaccharide transport system permease protein
MAEAKNSVQEEKWDIVIKPKDKLFSVDFEELWRYRDLCGLFVKRNIITQYKQTILGPAWFVIQPALTVIMYMVVFGGIAGIPTDGVPRPLFYLAGTCMWQYFASCLNNTSNTFVSNSGIFGKVYFPRLIMPVASVISNLLRLGIQFSFFVIVYIVYSITDPTCHAHLT